MPKLPDWRFSFSLGWLWAPFMAFGSGLKGFLFASRSSEEMKMALDEDKFQLLIAHIDGYIDATMGRRFEENNQVIIKETSDKILPIIVMNVNDALVNHHYKLTAADLDVIADKIKIQVEREFSDKEKLFLNKFTLLHDENLLRIQEQIRQNLHFSEIKLENQNVDLNELLLAILNSDKLLTLIDSRVKPAFHRLDGHDVDIDGIKLDLANMKADIVQSFASFGADISGLKSGHKKFGDDFYKFKMANDEKLQQMLLEIDGKISTLGASHFSSIDASVRKNLLNILGFGGDSSAGEMSEESIKNWISSMFVAKSQLEERLKQVEANGNKAFQLELNKNAGILMGEINEGIKKQVAAAFTAETRVGTAVGGLSEADVLRIVNNVLAVYDADKTGLVDFALESAGGQVLSTRCTENYQTKSAEISIFGIPLWYPSNTPRTVISPSVQPGECWAFQGFPGFLVVQLNNFIQITGFTMEHIPQSLAPNGIIDSAPNSFSVWGLATEMDKDPTLLGSYHYSAEPGAPSLQYFPVQNDVTQDYQIIELRVESNHGNPRYTCLYRFRVHGNVKR